MKIAVVGLWQLGEVVAASLAELGHHVVGVEKDKSVIENFKSGVPFLEEPGLRELLKKNLASGHLSFSDDFSKLADCEAVFLAIDTPVTEQDETELRALYDNTKKLAPFLGPDSLFVVMSQVPVGTTKELLKIIKEVNPSFAGNAIYFPENLQLGKGLQCFFHPDRFVIGIDDKNIVSHFENIIKDIHCPRLFMNIASAEMSKHALNSFLAASLSYIYNISDLCESTGADATDVTRALRSDPRIGEAAYLDTSLGFSGGTLMRDLKTLKKLGDKFGLPSEVIKGVLKTNEDRRAQTVKRLERVFGRSLHGLRIGVLGVTYKPGTSTLRRSLGLEIVEILQKEGVEVAVYDPLVVAEEFHQKSDAKIAKDVYDLAEGRHGLLLVTACPEFVKMDLDKIKNRMLSPHVFFDTRNFLKEREEEMKRAGLKYFGIGRPFSF